MDMEALDPEFLSSAVKKHYAVGHIYRLNQLVNGNSSGAVNIETEQGTFIARKLRKVEQGEVEYAISSLMKDTGLCAEVIPSIMGEGYIIEDDRVMNIQRYIEQEKYMLTQKQLYMKLGESVAILHSKLHNVSLPSLADRFSIQPIWDTLKCRPIDSEIFKKLSSYIPFCNMLEQQLTNQMIHGDLGVWNILFQCDSIYIIDFGEARRGNIHFDVAALLSSTIKSSEKDSVIEGYITEFQHSYNRINPGLNLHTLYDYLILWIIRGICAIFVRYGTNERTISYMSQNLAVLERYHTILR